jgi:hypothetical protein
MANVTEFVFPLAKAEMTLCHSQAAGAYTLMLLIWLINIESGVEILSSGPEGQRDIDRSGVVFISHMHFS